MISKETLKFKKNESFYIRDGWMEKAINTIKNNEGTNIFAKNDGINYLGIGSNMVKGLKYWLQASRVIESSANKTILSCFGELIHKYDRYCETSFTWFLIHYQMCTNYFECPMFYAFFNSDIKSIKRSEISNYVSAIFSIDGFQTKKEYVDDDSNVFLKSYIGETESLNPEDNYTCPLSNLKLIMKKDDNFEKVRPKHSSLSYLIVYYSLAELYGYKSFNIEDSFDKIRSPFLLFNLDKNMYLQYLEEMKKNGLITINKTAGLNTVYFEKRLSIQDIFQEYFGGEINVL